VINVDGGQKFIQNWFALRASRLSLLIRGQRKDRNNNRRRLTVNTVQIILKIHKQQYSDKDISHSRSIHSITSFVVDDIIFVYVFQEQYCNMGFLDTLSDKTLPPCSKN
jgi:hypothetical protein